MNITLEQIKADQEQLAIKIALFEKQASESEKFYLPETIVDLQPGEHYAGLITSKDGEPSYHLVLLPGEKTNITWDKAIEWVTKQFGENIQEGVVGFGDSPDEAMWAFDAAWRKKLSPLPSAQPAPIEQDTSVRKAWARFSNELHRSPHAPYPGMSEAFEQHFSQSFTDREWRAESATWAAAWKAAKNHGAQPAPSVPDGYKLVPIEPTPEMMCALIDGANQYDSWKEGYRDMLAAAPETKP